LYTVQLSAGNTKHDGLTVQCSYFQEKGMLYWYIASTVAKRETVQDDMSICTECRDVIEYCKFTSCNLEGNVCLIFY
jgi:hypothetical protein